jgi:hypothetical protein
MTTANRRQLVIPSKPVSKSGTVNKSPEKSDRGLLWLVRRSHYPLDLPGEKLGTVQAPTRVAAEQRAEAQFGGAVTVEPAHATTPEREERLERAVRAAQRGRDGHARVRRQAMARRGADSQ